VNILEISKKRILEEGEPSDNPNVTVTTNGNYICQ